MNDNLTVIVYESADGWRWHTKAGNGRIVAESGEGYTNKDWAISMARDNAGPGATVRVDDAPYVD